MGPLKTLSAAFLVALSSVKANARSLSSLGVPTAVEAHAEFRNSPNGLRNITFSYDLSKVDHRYSWQYSAAFWFGDTQDDVAYLAIQPYPAYVRISFYTFTPGAIAINLQRVREDGNWNQGCIPSADGVFGASCHIFIPKVNYDDLFRLSVVNLGGNTWAGKYINATNYEFIVGEWTLPHSRPIEPGVDYFLEALTGTNDCISIPKTLTIMGRPVFGDTGELAEFQRPYTSGKCGPYIRINAYTVDSGIQVAVRDGSRRNKRAAPMDTTQLHATQPHNTPQRRQTPPTPQQQPGPSLGRSWESGHSVGQSVPWKTEAQHQALCRGYMGNDAACISAFEQYREEISRYAFVYWWDLVRCVNKQPLDHAQHQTTQSLPQPGLGSD